MAALKLNFKKYKIISDTIEAIKLDKAFCDVFKVHHKITIHNQTIRQLSQLKSNLNGSLNATFAIERDHHQEIAKMNDWLIKDNNGNLSVCTDTKFNDNYESFKFSS